MPAGDGPPGEPEKKERLRRSGRSREAPGWGSAHARRRADRRPRRQAYLAALHLLVTGTSSTATQVVAVVVFVVIDFLPIIVAWSRFLELRPEAGRGAGSAHAQDWLLSPRPAG